MSRRKSTNCRLQIETLEGRDTPSTFGVEPAFNPKPEPPGRPVFDQQLGVFTAVQRAASAAQTRSIIIAGGVSDPNELPGRGFAHMGIETAELVQLGGGVIGNPGQGL